MQVEVFLAAMPWTYWMALPILALSALTMVTFGLVYLKKVVEPSVLRQDALQAAGAAQLAARRSRGVGKGRASLTPALHGQH